MTGDYHSVYRQPAGAPPVGRWEGPDGSTAFVHDIMTGLPDAFNGCDVLYADLPWRAGFDDYNTRAAVADGRTYRQFLDAVAVAVDAFGGPTVLVTGRHAVPVLSTSHGLAPTRVIPLTMPVLNQPAVALLYNLSVAADRWQSTADLLANLAATYRDVADFCCGYGQSARAFAATGKRFTVCDFNAECIGYIASHASEWRQTA